MSLTVQTKQRTHLMVNTDSATQLSLQPQFDWFSADFWYRQRAVVATAQGRGTTYFVKCEGRTLVLKQYLRGGMIRHLSQQHFLHLGLKHSRPWQELLLLDTMQQAGLPVPLGLAGLVKTNGLAYRASIITQYIEGATSLHHLLCKHSMSDLQWQKVGQLIRQFHDKQIYHHDLNVHNIIFDEENALWLIDFDKCQQRLSKHSSEKWKRNNLDRFYRSLLKEHEKASTYHFKQASWLAFQQGYLSESIANDG
jgi:3-deoxy-D-manno-octulosonic acid kinase